MHQVFLSNHFLRQFKPFIKKFRNLETDLVDSLEKFRPESSDCLGQKLYKVRLKSSDVPKGKSKSFRAIVFLAEFRRLLVPITVYFKSDKKDISEKEIEYHLAMVLLEIRKQKK